MLRGFCRSILARLSICSLCIFLFACSGEEKKQEQADDSLADGTNATADDALGLALERIEMSQGEKGFELWRLKADWANMKEEDGKILVSEPRLTYFLPPPDEEELYVTSDSGDINQDEQILRFMGNVVILQGTSEAKGDILIYNGTAQSMTFPEGGQFFGATMNGTAPFVRWHMNKQLIEASGRVTVNFQGKSLGK